jgi:O-antigen/teichoic acid export membrane protein
MSSHSSADDTTPTDALPAASIGAPDDGLRGGLWRFPRSAIDRVRRDSLARNSLFIMSTTVANSVFGYVFWLLGARLFPAQVVGLTAALISASTILTLLASVGVGGMLVQSLPETGGSAAWSLTFWAGMAIGASIGLVIGSVTLLVLPLIDEEFAVVRDAGYATVVAVLTFAMISGYILDYAFVAVRAAGNMLIRNSIVAFGKVALVIVLALVAGANTLTMLGAWAASAVVGLSVGFGLLIMQAPLRRPPRVSILARKARGLRTRLAGQQLIDIGGALLPYLLSVLVTARLSSSANAYFYTTWMMCGVFLIVSPAVSLSLFAEGAHNPNNLRARVRSALAIIGAILVPGAAAVLVFGGMLLSTFGPAYEQHGTALLQIVVLASFPDAITNVYVSVLRVRRRLARAAGLNLAMAIGTVALSWALLPAFGLIAVGWAFLATRLSGCLIVIFSSLRPAPVASTPESAKHGETI